MLARKYIQKTREYLDYLDRHIDNVERAWKEVQEKCSSMHMIWEDFYWHSLDLAVKQHDLSKFSKEEFTQYRAFFYPVDDEITVKEDFDMAWAHHKICNDHHWENWTQIKECHPNEQALCCTHMVVDWLAMSYEFGDTPRSYYENNKDSIHLPTWAQSYICQMFDLLEAS